MVKTIYLLIIILTTTEAFSTPADSSLSAIQTDSNNLKQYHANRPVVSGLIVAGSVIDYLAILPLRKKPIITDVELANLNTDLLNPIDSWALKQSSSQYKTFQKLSDYGQIPIFLLPAFLLQDEKIRKEWFDLFLIYWEGHTITFFSYNYSFLGPRFQNRFRPLVYYNNIPLNERNIGYNRSSFYSGHTASVTYTTFFMAKVYYDYHPEVRQKKLLLYTVASIIPAVEGYLRVRSLAHFPSDCFVGYALGATVGIVIPEIHKIQNRDLSVGMFSSPEGTGLSLTWKGPVKHKK